MCQGMVMLNGSQWWYQSEVICNMQVAQHITAFQQRAVLLGLDLLNTLMAQVSSPCDILIWRAKT